MKRKVLIVIIAVLSAILVAGLAILFISANAHKIPAAQAPQETVSGEQQGYKDLPADADSETVVAPEDTQPGSDVLVTPGETANGETGNQGENTIPNATVPATVPGTSTTAPTTQPTTPGATTPTTQPTTPGMTTEPTTPATTPGATEPTDGPIVPNVPTDPDTTVPEKEEMGYLSYHNMSGAEQAAFINSFPSIEAFFDWYNAAKEAYENDMIEIDGSTPIDAGQATGGE